VTLSPEKDWSGTENLTFTATDDDHKILANITITVAPVDDPPEQPMIISPADGLNITDVSKLDFEGQCTDPDLPYGDELTFSWSSDISGDLGTGIKLNGIKLPAGEHEITLTVTDNSGNSSFTTINVNVSMEETGAAPISFEYYSLIIIVIFILILIMIFFILKKKRSAKSEKSRALR